MVGCPGELVDVPVEWAGHPRVERRDDPIALVAVDLDRGEGLGATLAFRRPLTCDSYTSHPDVVDWVAP